MTMIEYIADSIGAFIKTIGCILCFPGVIIWSIGSLLQVNKKADNDYGVC